MTRTVTITFDDQSQHVYQNVPDDITPDAIEQRAAGEFQGKRITGIDGGRFAQTNGGAATGNPSLAAQGERTVNTAAERLGENLATVGVASGIGAAAGALAPEILTGLGAVAAATPVTAPAAPFLFGAGSAVRGARVASAIGGAAGGAVGEMAGQTAEALGAGTATAEATRFVAGGLTPETGRLALTMLKKYVATPALSVASKFRKESARAILEKLEGNPASLTEQERQHLDRLLADFRGGGKTDDPMREVYEGLEDGALRARAISQQEAAWILREGDNNARSALEQTLRGPVSRYREGVRNLEEIGREALAAAQRRRSEIGADREVSDIGADLRNVIVGRNQQALEARSAAYRADEAARDAVVQAREQQGVFVESMPEYKALVDDLRGKLLIGQKAQQQTTAPVTEQGVLRNYQGIYDAVTQRRVQTGTNAEGNPVYKTFPTSFQALDEVRRRLGDVFRGKPGEGYEAISDSMAREFYARITDIQKKFAGEPQERLLQHYGEASEGLAMFGSKAGKRATAVDRYDDSRFSTDAAQLPAQFLKTSQGVRDLIELTGDKALVTKAAGDYAARQLDGKSAEQVRGWMRNNSDWLRQVPDVLRKVDDYAGALERGQRISKNTERGIGIVRAREADAIRSSEREATRIRADAEASANRMRAWGESEATTLLGDSFPVARVKQLIESGSRSQWDVAGPAIARNPTARAATLNAVRHVIADRAERSTAGIVDFYARNIRPAVEGAGLITTQQADDIATELARIQDLKIPEGSKLGMAKRVVLQSINAYAATVGGRAAVGGYEALTQ